MALSIFHNILKLIGMKHVLGFLLRPANCEEGAAHTEARFLPLSSGHCYSLPASSLSPLAI